MYAAFVSFQRYTKAHQLNEQDHHTSYALARCYRIGLGTYKDNITARNLLATAADLGHVKVSLYTTSRCKKEKENKFVKKYQKIDVLMFTNIT
jgi:TPR repeat protein